MEDAHRTGGGKRRGERVPRAGKPPYTYTLGLGRRRLRSIYTRRLRTCGTVSLAGERIPFFLLLLQTPGGAINQQYLSQSRPLLSLYPDPEKSRILLLLSGQQHKGDVGRTVELSQERLYCFAQ